MTKVQTIFEATRSSRAIYYPELAYFLPEYEQLSSPDEEAFVLQEHRRKLRILALYFDLVLIPPEHFVRARMAARLYADPLVRPLFDAGILVTTFWNRLTDAASFIESLEAYLAGIGQGHVVRRPNVAQLKAIRFFLRDVTNQSQLLKNTLVNHARQNKVLIDGLYGPQVYRELTSVIEKSCYKDLIPFSHERFGFLLRQAEGVPDRLKREIWERSCTFYLDAGVVGNYCFRYPALTIERSKSTRLKYQKIYAILFHPLFLELFLSALGVPHKALRNLERLDAAHIITLRETTSAWFPLKAAFFDLVVTLSADLEAVERESGDRTVELSKLNKARCRFRAILLSRSSRGSAVLEAAASLLVDAVSVFTGIPGVAYAAEKVRLKEKLEDYIIRFRHPAIRDLTKFLIVEGGKHQARGP
jgi:hypothetical protein